VPYQLDETKNWALSIDSLRESVRAARAAGKCVRGLVFINPGNPTGQCLGYDNLKALIKCVLWGAHCGCAVCGWAGRLL